MYKKKALKNVPPKKKPLQLIAAMLIYDMEYTAWHIPYMEDSKINNIPSINDGVFQF